MAQLKDLIVNGVSRFIGDIFGNKVQLTTLEAPTTSGGSTYGPGSDGQVLKSNGTSAYWASDSNSDTLVKQTAKTDNVNYKILTTVSASPTSGNAAEAAYDTDITLNPSTNTITATNFAGNASTATSASKLQNTSKVGDTNKPVYFTANGVPAAISYTVDKSVPSTAVFTDTTYTFANGTNGFTVTPAGGTAQTVTVTPSITNNVTGSGTSGYIAKFNGANTITNGPAFGSSTSTYLRNDGSWETPPDNDTKNTAGSTDTSSKIYLVGAISQAANPQTYSDDQVYATDGVLSAKTLDSYIDAKLLATYTTTTSGYQRFVTQVDNKLPFSGTLRLRVYGSTTAINQQIDLHFISRNNTIVVYGADSTRTASSGNSGIYYIRGYATKEDGNNSTYASYYGGIDLYTNSTTSRTIEVYALELKNCVVESSLQTSTYDSTYYNYTTPTTCLNKWWGLNTANTADAASYASGLWLSGTRRKNGSAIALSGYSLFGVDAAGVIQAISVYSSSQTSSVTSINTARVYNTNGMVWENGLYYNSASGWLAASGDYNSNAASSYYLIDFRYTDNCVASSSATTLGMVQRKPVYLRGVIKNDGLFYLQPISVTYSSATYKRAWTQDIPTQEETVTIDGVAYNYVYWFIGYPYYDSSYAASLYRICLEPYNPVFWYKDGSFRKFEQGRGIKNVTRSGTTFTVTRDNNSTFTFTQQDSDRYVNSAAFADDTTATPASPVKMTLTRAGSDTSTVTANIPKVSSSGAGVVPKGAAVSTQSQTTKFLREDGSWAAPSYTAAGVTSVNGSTGAVTVAPAGYGLGVQLNTLTAITDANDATVTGWFSTEISTANLPANRQTTSVGVIYAAVRGTYVYQVYYDYDNHQTFERYRDFSNTWAEWVLVTSNINKNLLRNWYFVGGGSQQLTNLFPINTRGNTTYTSNEYNIDGWINYNSPTLTLSANGLTVSKTGAPAYSNLMRQYIESWSNYIGKTVTFSALIENATAGVFIGIADGVTTSASSDSVAGTNLLTATATIGSTATMLTVNFYNRNANANPSFRLIAAKLEIGSQQTLAHRVSQSWVLNELPNYQEELLKCQTSSADKSDTYANKSLATQQQIAYVESGTTATKTYSVGDYFCWNGLLYRVKQAIQSGASFTVGTNCEATTIADNAPSLFGLGIWLNTLSAVTDANNISATGFYNTQQGVTENLPVVKGASAANGAILAIVRGESFQYQIWVDYVDATIYHRIKQSSLIWQSWQVLASL